ncbi:CHAT domain-containing protein [Polynucleobacter sp. 73C-SIWE]|uniref:CHAT domain-containing protein n=1 Tax=Polynucleobacter sp. 73C-SIWE TaxID=2689098 RepID=UPI001C0D29F7|nr:CHAT domain-containing tetratricopeptide repeat protein [Polynucleobacter sp. 73C-SIWE]MBU3579464.1 CHAT domain-containing protein [Polynucleobacter sp. 73C-SIWE]
MRKHTLIPSFLIGCGILLFSVTALATTIKEEVDIEGIKAPPRDIKDILKLVEQTKPDLAIVERAQKVVAMPLPASQDNEVLNHFYTRRSAAFEDLGSTGEALKNLEIAVTQYPSNNPRLYLNDLIHLSILESSVGQQSKAITLIQKAQAHQLSALPNSSGFQMSMGRLLLSYYVNSGNFEAAQKTLENMNVTLSNLKRSRVYMEYGPNWEAAYESARGIYFSGQGQWVESERSLRKTLHFLEAQYQKVKNSSIKIDVVGDEARSAADASNNPRIYVSQILNRELNLANVLLRQRKLIDAEYYARKSITLSLSSFGSNSIEVARGLRSLAIIVNEQGRYAEAVLLSRLSLATVKAAGATGANSTLASAQRSLGTALVADGKYAEANQVFEEMAAGIKTDPEMAKSYQFGDLDWVLAMLKTGKSNQANEMVSSMLQRQEISADRNSPRLAMIRAFDAASLQAENKWTEADAAYKLSMPILIDQARNDAENDTTSIKQQQRMTFLLESYLASLANTAKTDPNQAATAAAQAFQIADIARGSGVQRALTASAARASIKDPQLAGLARQEQDLQRRINTLSELLTGLRSASPDQQLPAVQGKIRSDIEAFKSQREALKKEIEKKFPDYAELVEPKPASIERTQRLLKADEVLVSWYFSENTGYVWAISKQGAQFSQLSIGRKQMAKEVAQLRKALDPGVSTIDEIPPFDVALAFKLYQEILAPVEAGFKGKKVMLVVPHAELGQLPISLLVTRATNQPAKGGAIAFAGYKSVPWLTRDIAVAQVPSVTALTALRSLPEGNPNRKNFVGFGDPYFSSAQEKSAQKSSLTQFATRGMPLKLRSAPKTSGVSSAELALLPRLPDTSLEIEEIAKVVGAQPGDIFLHKQASVKQVTSMDLSDRKVVMFSTHGLVPGELNGLTQPALALSSPDVTGDKDDGLLTMDKVIALKLDADWVVLSACNTAAGEGAGSEAVSGLGRAFFFAGAKALLVSNWPVDSVASRALMTDLFKSQQKAQGTSKAELLRQAMLNQIDQGGMKEGGNMKYAYAHPLFWAPFVVVGD